MQHVVFFDAPKEKGSKPAPKQTCHPFLIVLLSLISLQDEQSFHNSDPLIQFRFLKNLIPYHMPYQDYHCLTYVTNRHQLLLYIRVLNQGHHLQLAGRWYYCFERL